MSGSESQLTTSQDERIRISALLLVLGTAFPSGATKEKLVLFADQILKARISMDDLGEAVQRILHTREQGTFPPLGVILGRCRDVALERTKTGSEFQIEAGRKPHRPTPAQVRELVAYRRLVFDYAAFYCHADHEWVVRDEKNRFLGCGCVPPCEGEVPEGAAIGMLARAENESWPLVPVSAFGETMRQATGSWT